MVQVLVGSTLFQRISKKSTAVRWGAKAVSPCVIAVMGIGGSVGTTHLCMMLANSMANGLKVRAVPFPLRLPVFLDRPTYFPVLLIFLL